MTFIRVPDYVQLAIESALEKKAVQIVVLDLRELSSFTDYFLICNGESEPQIKSIFKNMEEKMSSLGIRLHHVEGRSDSGWLLMDFGDFVVHIFSPEKRMFYGLERLWADTPRMEVADLAPARV